MIKVIEFDVNYHIFPFPPATLTSVLIYLYFCNFTYRYIKMTKFIFPFIQSMKLDLNNLPSYAT